MDYEGPPLEHASTAKYHIYIDFTIDLTTAMNISSKLILWALLSAPLAAIAGRDDGGAHDHGGDPGKGQDKYNRVTVLHHPASLNVDAQKVAFGNACGRVGGVDAQWDYVPNSAGGHDGWCHIPDEAGGGGSDHGFDVGAALGNESPEWKFDYYWYAWPPAALMGAGMVKSDFGKSKSEGEQYVRVHPKQWPSWMTVEDQKAAWGKQCDGLSGRQADWDLRKAHGGKAAWCHIVGGKDFGLQMMDALKAQDPAWDFNFKWYSWPPAVSMGAGMVKRSPDSGSSVWGGGPQKEQYLRIHPKQWPSWMTVADQKTAWGKECNRVSGGHANWDLKKAHGGKAAWCHVPGGAEYGGPMMENLPAQDPAWAFNWRFENWPPV
ncbi:hypothetical protein CBOM_05105 [Ceraceosorus bombacis]|uniref:Uncharacterized protein n=1 Tax=Ceraceosorus bombacis TaxID=401625 RepID=A0A0P1BIQ8_9BASI|nr:hypothetical protein CBOM_05105 [Ceraceosorus bombacis]